MTILLRIEEAAMFAACLFAFMFLDMSWWWFLGCILLPDIGMVGYLHNSKTGSFVYNLFHHKALAALLAFSGYLLSNQWFVFAGLIIFAHASLDRTFGYGFKYKKGFRFTHLGEIGTDQTDG